MIESAVAFQLYNGKYKFLESEFDIALICFFCDVLEREYNRDLLREQFLHPFNMWVKTGQRKTNCYLRQTCFINPLSE